MKFKEKLGHAKLNPESIYLYIMDLICNDSKHLEIKLLKNTFSKLFATVTKALGKDFFKLSNEEIYFILQSNITKYIKPFWLFHNQTLWKDTMISVLIFETMAI